MAGSLGVLASVDVRSFWPNEASAFTPWLAREENIELLGHAVGLELEVEHTEVACGPFAADIVARDSASNDYVVIENQLGKTDHDHLGKALTYAAALGATTVIWVAADFTDEHRKALNWLNENSSDDLAFYGVQIELWKIDGSNPAVRFNVVSRPTELARQVSAIKNGEVSDVKKLQFEWWTAFRDELLTRKAVPSAQSARPQYWYNIALGRTGIHLSATANTYDNRIGVRVYLMGKYGGAAALQRLLEEREPIEKEIGATLSWNPNPDARDKVIVIHRDADLSQRQKWPEYLNWLVEMTVRLRKAFASRIKALNLAPLNELDDVQ